MTCRLLLLFAALLAVACPVRAEDAEVVFYNWSDYLPPELLDRFTTETGIRVRYSTYDSNEAMYAKLKLLQGRGYDLVMPSTYYVDKMRKEGLLQPLDKSRLPGLRNLDPRLLDQAFDPGNTYSVPYLWGSTGIAVNAARIDPARVTAWADLWRPEFRRALLLPNDAREVFFIGLRTLGHSGNSTDPDQLARAYEKLRALMPNVRLFDSEAPQVLFITGEVDVGVAWNGNVRRARQEEPELRYIYPKEGCMLWMDNLAIPSGARNVAAAHRLIEFLLRPEIARIIAEQLGYASPNREAVRLLPAEYRNDPTIYPSEAQLSGCEYSIDVGDSITRYAAYWARLRTGD